MRAIPEFPLRKGQVNDTQANLRRGSHGSWNGRGDGRPANEHARRGYTRDAGKSGAAGNPGPAVGRCFGNARDIGYAGGSCNARSAVGQDHDGYE